MVRWERKKENVGRKKGLQIATSLQHGYAVMKTATILHARWNRMFSVYIFLSPFLSTLYLLSHFLIWKKKEPKNDWPLVFIEFKFVTFATWRERESFSDCLKFSLNSEFKFANSFLQWSSFGFVDLFNMSYTTNVKGAAKSVKLWSKWKTGNEESRKDFKWRVSPYLPQTSFSPFPQTTEWTGSKAYINKLLKNCWKPFHSIIMYYSWQATHIVSKMVNIFQNILSG